MPDCPHCGCNDVAQLSAGGDWWGPQCRCNHCRRTFSIPPESQADGDPPAPADETPGEVLYYVVCCPSCGHDRCPVTRSQRPIRYHRCEACGRTFKSREARSGG